MDDQSVDTVTADASAGADASSSADASAATLTDDHHDWASNFCGIDTRAEAETGSDSSSTGPAGSAASSSSDSDSGGIWGAITGAASSVVDTAENVASDVGNTVADAASGVADTVESVASDVGNTVADAASGVVNTVETAASGVVHTAEDAGSGILDTAEKVAGDIGSGNFGQALGDAADGVVTTAGHVASDAAHTVVDTGSAALDAAGKVVTDTQQTVADAATGVINTAGHVVSDVAHTVSDAAGPDSMLGQAAGAVGDFATSAAGAAVDTVNTITDFDKGVVEGAVGGVEGLAKGVVSLADGVGKEAYALATDEKAREDALNTVEHGAEAVGRFAETAVTDPGKAAGEVADAVESGASTVAHVAENVYGEYQQAAAAGHGAEFIGKGVGQAAVLVAGAVLTDGASVAAEGGAVAAEGAVALGEAGEVAALAGEAGQAGALAGEAGEAGALAGEAGQAGALAGEAGEEGAAAAAGANPEIIERPTYVPDPETPVPQGPGTAPTEFPSDPTQYPQPPGPAPDLGPGEPNPYEPYNPGQQPMNPNIPRPPRVPEITPDPTRLPPGATPGPGMELAEDAAEATGPGSAADVAETGPGGADGAGGGEGGGGGGERGGGGGEPPDEPMNLGEDAERQRDILEEFEEHQQRYGQQQRELPEEGPDPNFDEPNRMPELDQGPDPVRRDVSLGDVKPTQSDISPVMGDGTPLEDVTANMREEGWDATQPDPQMVQNDDGSLSTLDHRRLSAAEGAEIDEVPATVHAPDEPIPEDQAERFQLKKKFTDPATGKEYPKGSTPDNWSEAAKFREANQGGEMPRAGRTPDIRPKAPSPSAAEPSLSERAEEAMRRFQEQDPRARQAAQEFEDAERAREADLEAGDL